MTETKYYRISGWKKQVVDQFLAIISERDDALCARIEELEGALHDFLYAAWQAVGRSDRCQYCDSAYPKHEEDCVCTPLVAALGKDEP